MVPYLLDQLKTVNTRHAKIGDEHGRWVGIELAESFVSRPSRCDLCACCVEQLRDQRQSVCVVVNGEDMNALQVAERKDA